MTLLVNSCHTYCIALLLKLKHLNSFQCASCTSTVRSTAYYHQNVAAAAAWCVNVINRQDKPLPTGNKIRTYYVQKKKKKREKCTHQSVWKHILFIIAKWSSETISSLKPLKHTNLWTEADAVLLVLWCLSNTGKLHLVAVLQTHFQSPNETCIINKIWERPRSESAWWYTASAKKGVLFLQWLAIAIRWGHEAYIWWQWLSDCKVTSSHLNRLFN